MGGMFIEVVIVLTGVEFAVLLFDKEERRHLGAVRRVYYSGSKFLFEEVLCGFLFIRG